LGAALRTYPFLKNIMPSRLKGAGIAKPIHWINERDTDYFKLPLPLKLQDTLVEQTLYSSLPVLLRYEDRNSMAWSIESRVPFMDYRFVEFAMSLPEHLVFPRGTRKYILREAMRPIFPQKIYERKDKMGFVTPEEVWLKGQGKDWLYSCSEKAIQSLPELLNKPKAMSSIDEMLKGTSGFDFSYWRLACIGLWLDS
jgi:asparagine synthase (glutamine-hydrolysing)